MSKSPAKKKDEPREITWAEQINKGKQRHYPLRPPATPPKETKQK